MKNLDEKVISAMRGIAIDAINNAKGGHMGMAIGAASISYSVIAKNLNISKENPKWINRDKFILSAGHGSMCFYSIMHFLGLLTLDDLKKHKKLNSKTPSHPEIDKFAYVDASTGPLGQGVAMGVGMALSQQYLANKYNKPGFNLFDHHVFVLHGDGCMQEGVALEAIQLAGTLNLNKLILIHDFNETQIDSKSYEVNNIDFIKFFESNNFNTFDCQSDLASEILETIEKAKKSNKPSYIRIHTNIAKYTPFENMPKGHNGTLDEKQTIEFKQKCGLKSFTPFEYEKEIYDYCQSLWDKKQANYSNWQTLFFKYSKKYPNEYKEIQSLINKNYQFILPKKLAITNKATRDYVGEIVKILEQSPFIIGGSADLKSSTKVGFETDIIKGGKNIKYGIREFAMGAINNGIYLASNLKTIDSTFFSFADYAKPAIRLGSIMKIPSIHVFSHDSYQVGGDGPTHQPFDQLPMLRAMNNVKAIRPCDEKETLEAFKWALKQNQNQIVIITCRQPIASLKNRLNVFKAAYIIKREDEFDLSILASGSEVSLAYEISNELAKKHHIKSQVISVPLLQNLVSDNKLIKQLEIAKKPIFAIETSSDSMWYQLAKYNKFDCQLALTYGESTNGQEIYELKGFNKSFIIKKIKKLLLQN
ncbi:transketolase-like TK C-terminal-containing protein [Metamycoplasma equirhinis]|uniref:transketolase-like TK C-terminal-containing protein n=1 Tax=Metamycoplasma equirhinis TaxID=92402 RepID=UPI003592ED64